MVKAKNEYTLKELQEIDELLTFETGTLEMTNKQLIRFVQLATGIDESTAMGLTESQVVGVVKDFLSSRLSRQKIMKESLNTFMNELKESLTN